MAEEQRTSARSTKGAAPRRLGFEDEESATSPRTSFNRQTPSLASSRTSGSAPSVMEARCALLEARKRVAEAEADLASLNLERASRRSGTPKSSSPTMREEVFEEERRSEMQAPTAANGSDEVSVLYPAKSVQSGQTSDPDLIDLSADSVCDPRTVKSRSTSGRTVERLQGVGKNSVLVSDSVSTGTQRKEQAARAEGDKDHLRELLSQARQSAEQQQRKADQWRQLFLEECAARGSPADRAVEQRRDTVTDTSSPGNDARFHAVHEYEPRPAELRGARSVDKSSSYHRRTPAEYHQPVPKDTEDVESLGDKAEPTQHLPPAARARDQPIADEEHTPAQAAQTSVVTAVSQLAEALAGHLTTATQRHGSQDTGSDLHKIVARQSTAKDLPEFNGDPASWPMFRHMFTSSTSECKFSNAENMARLQKALKGKAKDTVKAMLIVPDNVDRVMQTLEMRFGQPEQVIRTIIDGVKKLKPAGEEDFEALIDTANAVGNLVATMQLMNDTGHLTNPTLRQEVIMKLPNSLKRQWGEFVHTQQTGVTLATLSEWLSQRADAISHVRRLTATDRAEKPPSGRRPGGLRGNTFTAREEQCGFCKKAGHSAANCNTLKKALVKDRWKWIKNENRCFVCFGCGHQVRDCPKKARCGRDGCERLHQRLLHLPQPSTQERTGDQLAPCNATQRPTSGRVMLRTVPINVTGTKGTVHTFALLDEASTVTLLDASLAKEIGAKGTHCPLTLTWTDDTSQTDNNSRKVEVSVFRSGQEFYLNDVRTVTLDLPKQDLDVNSTCQHWKHLRDADLTVEDMQKPRMLIGQDICDLIMPREWVEGPPGSPVATRCKLGWAIHGRVDDLSTENAHSSLSAQIKDGCFNDDLHLLVKSFFTTDSFGVKVTSTKIRSRQEARAERIMESTTRRVGDRWETGLLWRESGILLPESKPMALRRLFSIERKMDRDQVFADAYCSKIEQYLAAGYAFKLTPEEETAFHERKWYQPHFGVTNPNKPGKLRLVFDAAASSNGMSLNDALVPGPDLLNSLTGVLFKFREHRIAFGGDIQQMFHQVQIREEDQPSQRFLWRGMKRDREPDAYQMKAMTFGAVCSPASAQFVMRRNAEEFRDNHEEAVYAINRKHYMDDYFDSTPTVETAVARALQVVKIHKAGGFTIRSWVSNSSEVLASVPPELRSDSALTIDSGETATPTEKTLGLKWMPREDIFSFKLSARLVTQEAEVTQPTKRHVLRMCMSVFDPLGYLAFHTVSAKVLLQRIWRTGVSWDQPLPDDLVTRWKEWWQMLLKLSELSVPRPYSEDMIKRAQVQLHVVGDASELAFAAAAYLRVTFADGSAQVAFVLGKGGGGCVNTCRR